MDAMAVAKRISAARKARGMTQEELAAKADVSSTHIGVIERGVKIPNLDTFIAIANALEVSADSKYVWDYPFRFPLALVLGNEAQGVDSRVLAECEGVVSLPMAGAKTSLNVGNCAAAALYAVLGKYQYGAER